MPAPPPRLLHAAAPDARELVRSAREDSPRPGTRQAAFSQVVKHSRRRSAMQRMVWLGLSVGFLSLTALWAREQILAMVGR